MNKAFVKEKLCPLSPDMHCGNWCELFDGSDCALKTVPILLRNLTSPVKKLLDNIAGIEINIMTEKVMK